MEDNKILLKIVVDDSGSIVKFESLEKGISDIDVSSKKAQNSAKNLVNSLNKLGRGATVKNIKLTKDELKKLRIEMGQAKNSTGAATAATMELGRVISDAPYGIRGMANNVSQLASNVFFMAKEVDAATGKTVGLLGAFQRIGSSLMGTMGVLVAFQAVVAAVEWFSSRTEKAKKSTSDLNSELNELAKILRDDVKVSIEDYVKLMGRKKEVDDKAKEIGEEINELIAERISIEKQAEVLRQAIDEKRSNDASRYFDLLGKERELQDKINRLYKEGAEEIKNYNEEKDKLLKSGKGEPLAEALAGSAAFWKKRISELTKYRDNVSLTKSQWDNVTKSIKAAKNELEKITGKELEPKEEVEAMLFSDRIIEDFVTSFEDEMRKIDLLKAAGYFSEEMYESAKRDLEERFASQNILDGIAPKLELGENAKAAIDKYNKELLKVATDKMAAEDWAGYADAFKQGLSLVSDFVDAQFERDLAIEQNKTTAMNDELNQRLLNENLSKDERAKIQQEIWQNDDKLRKKQNEIKKKQFNANKAFQISMAVADTASSALKAYGSQLVVGDPTSIVRAKIAAGVATAIGLAQVATIASQKFVPESASTPIRTASAGGGGGGVGDRSFNFNLVGASQQNQLAQAIQGTFDKPIKAYVVSKDITNQQQLDANTKSTARFGG